MHTYDYKDEKGTDIYFHYNGDFSGDVTINSDNKELEIPAKAILEFVAYCYVLSKKIGNLEEMNFEELLIGHKKEVN